MIHLQVKCPNFSGVQYLIRRIRKTAVCNRYSMRRSKTFLFRTIWDETVSWQWCFAKAGSMPSPSSMCPFPHVASTHVTVAEQITKGNSRHLKDLGLQQPNKGALHGKHGQRGDMPHVISLSIVIKVHVLHVIW